MIAKSECLVNNEGNSKGNISLESLSDSLGISILKFQALKYIEMDIVHYYDRS